MDMDWNAVGAIGQWAGAIATFLAVLVAILSSRREGSIRVSSNVSIGIILSPLYTDKAHAIFSLTNIGYRTIKITNMGITFSNKRSLFFHGYVPKVLPKRLEENENVQILIPVTEIADACKEEGYKGVVKLNIFWLDSRDNKHWKKWKLNIDDWLK